MPLEHLFMVTKTSDNNYIVLTLRLPLQGQEEKTTL